MFEFKHKKVIATHHPQKYIALQRQFTDIRTSSFGLLQRSAPWCNWALSWSAFGSRPGTAPAPTSSVWHALAWAVRWLCSLLQLSHHGSPIVFYRMSCKLSGQSMTNSMSISFAITCSHLWQGASSFKNHLQPWMHMKGTRWFQNTDISDSNHSLVCGQKEERPLPLWPLKYPQITTEAECYIVLVVKFWLAVHLLWLHSSSPWIHNPEHGLVRKTYHQPNSTMSPSSTLHTIWDASWPWAGSTAAS